MILSFSHQNYVELVKKKSQHIVLCNPLHVHFIFGKEPSAPPLFTSPTTM